MADNRVAVLGGIAVGAGVGFILGRYSVRRRRTPHKDANASEITTDEFLGATVQGPIVGSFSSIAGSGEAGLIDGDGTGARFNFPGGITLDAHGNILVADCGNHCIRKISSSGCVTTLAGSGNAGLLDGDGLVSRFLEPMDIVADGDGSLVIVECGNHCIRKIAIDGSVSRFVGSGIAGFVDGDGVDARFNLPMGIVVDAQGTMVVVDEGNHSIRKVTPGGTVSTFAGCGCAGFIDGRGEAARFNLPADIAIDRDGNFLVADCGNHCIRRVSIDGKVSTLAGSDAAGFVDGKRASARFKRPVSIAIDGDGNLIVGDDGNHCIRKVTPNGNVSTLAVIGFEPCGIAIDLDGNIIVSGLHFICKIVVGLAPARPSHFTADMLKMMQNASLADVIFIVGEEEIPAHRVVLMARSEYFSKMLSSPCTEGHAGASIAVPHVNPTAFRSMLTYLYANVLEVDDDGVADVAQLADQYSLDDLFDCCVRYCTRCISTKNAVWWLVQFDGYHLDGLRAMALDFVCSRLSDIKVDAPHTIKHLTGTLCHEVIMQLHVV